VELREVTYSHDGVRRALDGVTLELPVGSTIGVVGPSGAGKSTMAEVLLGLRAPDSGRVLVNGIDLAHLDRSDWSRLAAFVPQHQQFASMSIRENIRFLRPWISDDDVVDAARRAHVIDEIERLPDGFDHQLGSRTRGLSGGQRQRIAIARALAGRPSLLVLDEPTSALDAATEQRFRETLDDLHGSITIVVIAHRPATLDGCDVVVRLARGRVSPATAA
jgi:ABC-type bacteriocin/lantibiotic exporter with double-glycine peptidase domain